MATSARPSTPEELIQRLSELVPHFATEWAEDRADEEWTLTFHRVMRTFTYVFGKARVSLSDAQLKGVANLVNDCVAFDDDIENAVSTCFLEHLHQVNSLKSLWPYLSPKARRECHA